MRCVKGRRLIQIVARWTLAVLLFAQGALVAEACLRLDTTPQAAFATVPIDGGDTGATSPNACLLGFLDQSEQTAAHPIVSPPATSYVVVASSAANPAAVFDARTALHSPGCAPPIPIRYCTLLIWSFAGNDAPFAATVLFLMPAAYLLLRRPRQAHARQVRLVPEGS
jgi:hypothetical protein